MLSTHKLFKKLDGRSVSLVVTVASDAIRASLFYFETGMIPRVLAHTHQQLPVQDFVELDVLHRQVLRRLPFLCDDIIKKGRVLYEMDGLLRDHQRIHEVVVLFASPWTDKQVHVEKKDFDNYTVITQETLNSLLESEVPHKKTKLDTFVSSLKINGYETTLETAVGRKVRSLELAIIDTYIREDYSQSIKEVIQAKCAIDANDIRCKPFSSALFTGLKYMFEVPQDYIVMYVHAQNIDVFICNNNQVIGYESLSYGYNEIILQILKSNLAFTTQQAYSLLELYNKGHLEEKVGRAIALLIETETTIMDELITVGVNELSQELRIPHDWYIVCDNPLMSVISQSIQDTFSQNRVYLVGSKNMKDLFDQEQSGILVPGSAMAGLYVYGSTS